MNLLFLHQNCPGQYRHLAPSLQRLGHRCIPIAGPCASGLGDIPLHRLADQGISDSPGLHPWARDLQDKCLRAEAAAHQLLDLLQEGFGPDLVIGHPGWGELLAIKDVLPDVPVLHQLEFVYQLVGADVGADRISVIHEGSDTVQIRPDAKACVQLRRAGLTFRPGDEVPSFVARNLEPYRGFHVFIRMFPLLLARRPHCQVLIVGGDGVRYGAAPADGRNWRQTLLEAMSCGAVVVASATAPVQEVICDGVNGFLVDFFAQKALAGRIAAVLAAPEAHRPIAEAARQHVQARYGLHSICLPALLADGGAALQCAGDGPWARTEAQAG